MLLCACLQGCNGSMMPTGHCSRFAAGQQYLGVGLAVGCEENLHGKHVCTVHTARTTKLKSDYLQFLQQCQLPICGTTYTSLIKRLRAQLDF